MFARVTSQNKEYCSDDHQFKVNLQVCPAILLCYFHFTFFYSVISPSPLDLCLLPISSLRSLHIYMYMFVICMYLYMPKCNMNVYTKKVLTFHSGCVFVHLYVHTCDSTYLKYEDNL